MTTPGLFVTGTDTGVGKTLFTAALAAALCKRGMRVAVMKPVETGCALREDQDATAPVATRTPADFLLPADACALIDAAQSDAPLNLVNPYRFAPAVAPAVAAQLASTEIDLKHVLQCMTQLREQADIVVVEGAGGLMVPLNDKQTFADLIAASGFPTVVVARSALGTINHCLLTVDALRQRGVPVAGVVLNRLQRRPSVEEAANPQQIDLHAGDVVRGVLPYFDDTQRADRDYLARRCEVHIDIDGILSATS